LSLKLLTFCLDIHIKSLKEIVKSIQKIGIVTTSTSDIPD